MRWVYAVSEILGLHAAFGRTSVLLLSPVHNLVLSAYTYAACARPPARRCGWREPHIQRGRPRHARCACYSQVELARSSKTLSSLSPKPFFQSGGGECGAWRYIWSVLQYWTVSMPDGGCGCSRTDLRTWLACGDTSLGWPALDGTPSFMRLVIWAGSGTFLGSDFLTAIPKFGACTGLAGRLCLRLRALDFIGSSGPAAG